MLLEITSTRVGQLAKDGYVPKPYTIEGIVRGYLRFLKDEARRSSKVAASSRKDDARTREIELRIAERENRLIDREEAIAVADEIVGTFRASFAGLASRVTRDLQLRKKIEADVDETLRKVAALLEDRGRSLEESGTAGPSFEEGDA